MLWNNKKCGKCRICSDNITDYNSGQCWCNKYYTHNHNMVCVSCPENCTYCKYNEETKKEECLRCDQGYRINLEKTCSPCEEGCKYCFLNEDSKQVCSFCFSAENFYLKIKNV